MGPIDLLVAGFEGYHRAEQVMDDLNKMDEEDTISILNAVVIKKDGQGNVSVSEDSDVRPGSGALFGALVGVLIGFLGGPGGAVVGAAAGAITGGITAAGIDMGFDNAALDEIKTVLSPNHSAILALIERDWTEQFVGEINGRNGRIIRTALREADLNRIRKERNKD